MLISPLLLKFKVRRVLDIFLVLAITVIAVSFFKESGGRIIFSDDHPSVFYRLSLLKTMFPQIPFYNPQWNAGVEARDFFSTGILNFFFLYLPLIQFFDLETTYNFLVIATVVVALPLSAYAGARILGLKREAGLVSGLLILGSSLTWYRWVFKYGTMGFATSAVISLFVFCFLCRFGSSEGNKPSRSLLWVTAILTCLMLTWTPIWFVFVPVGIFLLSNIRKLLGQRWFFGYSGFVLLFTMPWLIVWLKVANVLSYVTEPVQHSSVVLSAGSDPGEFKGSVGGTDETSSKVDRRKFGGRPRDLNAKNIFKELRMFAVGLNPLLFVLGLAGIVSLSPRHLRWVFGGTTCWLLILGAVVSLTKPHLELERLLVVLGLIIAIPVGNYISILLTSMEGAGTGFLARTAALPIMSCLLLTPIITASVVRNRSLEQFIFKPAVYDGLRDLVNKNGGNGRVVFSGFVLHELGGGHLAPLALDVDKPLVAISFVHDHWSYQGVVPRAYLDAGPAAVEQYFDYMNTTAVFAHERFWRRYFEERPQVYSYVGETGKFKMYQRNSGNGTYIYEGEGSVDSQQYNSIVVTPRSTNLVIKFRYIDALVASGCKLSPFSLPGELNLIKLTECKPGEQITISRVGEW
jgi:hypothetical protein